MRSILALPSPQPSGWGFAFFKRTAFVRTVAAFALVAAVVAGASPAAAANVTVTLRLSAGAYAAAFETCNVSVVAGGNGRAVLSAAVASGCIDSYQTSFGGAYLTCVDPGAAELCELGSGLVTFWAVYEDGVMSDGIAAFRAAAGKELGLSYTNFLTCPQYPNCPL